MQRQFAGPEFVISADRQPDLMLEQAADLIVQLAEPLLLRSEVTAMQRWLHALPEVLVQERAPLVLARILTEMASGQIATLGSDIHWWGTTYPAGAVAGLRARAECRRGDLAVSQTG
jgi:ATP/maltotriose-dependent transcriptional regulator MalT